ncbi:hypothetical protein AB0M36_11255 [Actinoplanes sp. NPDC051346]|uniref:hypothetical protein n=1 Tax=Actinoplanes sp. NPDC051346 TaxID=3155048 RepID=UPI003433A384
MNSRLSRPLLAVAISGALLAGSALVGTSPAFAADTNESTAAVREVLGDDPGTDPTTPPPPGTGTGTEPGTGTGTEPGTGTGTEPGTGTGTEPGTGTGTEPGTGTGTEPGTGTGTEPGTGTGTEPGTGTGTEPGTGTGTEPGTGTGTEPGTGTGTGTEPGTGTGTEPGTGTGTGTEPGTGTGTEPGTDTPTDKTPPVGSFTLGVTSLWIGQRVTLTQGDVTDETSTPEQISRVVNWGDGTSTTLRADKAPVRKQYTKVGRFTITVTLKDAAGNSAEAKAPTTNAVTVTSPGKFKLSKTTLWPGQRFTVSISGVPSGTKEIQLHWGDGSTSKLPGKSQSITTFYPQNTGKAKLSATFVNGNGASSAVPVGTITVNNDRWKPVVKVNKPKNSNRLKSWKYATGTVKDKGAGVPYVFVLATRITGNKVYCFTPKKKWKRVYNEAQFRNCVPVAVKVSKGKWSLKLTGLKKGTLYVDTIARDWGGNLSKVASVKAKITRN